jgi:hypothetical protein
MLHRSIIVKPNRGFWRFVLILFSCIVRQMPNPDQLKIAMPVHVSRVMAHALLYDGGRRVRDADHVMTRMTAEWLVERLVEAGYVVMKMDGAKAPSTSGLPVAVG